MTLIRRNQDWIPSVFNDLFDNGFIPKMNATVPAINVIEHRDNFAVEVAAPGMVKEDFSLRIDEDNNLVINMEKKVENSSQDEDSRYLRREFGYSKYTQTILLPDNVDDENISATMENGVLEIKIPKIKEEDLRKPQREITIG